ncbi:helix-turn-helix domain-containing protein [Candidatus Pacearchaeota archaeon]|jgi:transcriptional regulator with XRE-family HTH domain|nr:helix-turn-helix domain-containing protein [Candidatus Pacearchaeota archaeon]
MSIGENIKRLRIKKCLTQVALAEAAGISAVAVKKIEAGDREPKKTTRAKLAKVFGVNEESLWRKSR